jgi:hypothetical protein
VVSAHPGLFQVVKKSWDCLFIGGIISWHILDHLHVHPLVTIPRSGCPFPHLPFNPRRHYVTDGI